MNARDENGRAEDPVEVAFTRFHEAWFSGRPLDPDAFCRDHPECGPALRKEIDDFLFVVEGLSEVTPREGEVPERPGEPEKPPGTVLGDFRILREIGRGGMGRVYEAEQLSLNRKVALKVLPSHLSFSDEAVRKFRREAEAGGRQSHPAIVAIHAVGEHQGIHYIAQELVEGCRTLADKLEAHRKEKRPATGYFREVAGLAAGVADALQHAHDTGVIHRDIKPSNILLTKEGRPKITDFGLARVEDALALSRTGEFAGTPYYMSPEQAMSRRIGIDHRTDIYSLGVTLYEMLTLTRPFEGNTSQEVLKKIILQDPRDPRKLSPRVPRDMAVICLKAMEKKPEARYRSMGDLAGDLGRFLSGDVIQAKPPGAITRMVRRLRRNPAVAWSLGAALLAVLVLTMWGAWYFIELGFKNQEIGRLLDINRMFRLQEEAENLWPAYPEKIHVLTRWLEQAEGMRTRLDEHRRMLQALMAKSGRTGDEEVLLQRLKKLVSWLEKIHDGEAGLMMRVAGRLHFARSVYRESIDKRREEWDQAIASIADQEACPQYGGLEIEPQLGFVPIAKDPASGLWEFAHLQTGAVPKRGADGRLELTEETGLVFVLIPGGAFEMGAVKPSAEHSKGSPNVDPNAEACEGPVHTVRLEAFLISKYEMTQGQWLRITGTNPSQFNPSKKPDEYTLLHPVETVSWHDCVRWLGRARLRLPTESEWEYAARAGTATAWWPGDEKRFLQGKANLLDQSSKEDRGLAVWDYEEWLYDGYMHHAPVGTFEPNAFGLHDVCGNVSEWCRDCFGGYELTPRDGSACETEGGARYRIVRGGGWHLSGAKGCRSASRGRRPPAYRMTYFGVRPAAVLQHEGDSE